MKRVSYPIRFLIRIAAILTMCFMCGCPGTNKKDGVTLTGKNVFLSSRKNGNKGKTFVDIVRIRIETIEVPTGSASRSGKLWNYLDEEPVALKSRILGLNGLRIGVGKSETWPEVMRIMKKLTGKGLGNTYLQSTPGQTVPVTLREKRPIQTVFVYMPRGTLVGEDYPAGDNLLAFSITYDEDNPDQMIMTCVPQLRTTNSFRQLVTEDGVTTITNRPRLYTFGVLTFQLSLRANDFLVIGPGSRSHRPSSIGYHFMTKVKKGMRFETLLVLRPKIERVEVKSD